MASEAGVESLSLRNGVRCVVDTGVFVEEVLLAVGEEVGCGNIYSASRMNKAVVVFLKQTDLVSALVKSGITVRGSAVPVSPLSAPATRVMISNVPPFVQDEAIMRELARFGRFVSPMRAIPLGCKSSSVKHVLSFRRQILMVLNNQEGTLNVNFKCKVGDGSYTVFATTEPLRCFECGDVGHKRLSCPHGAAQPGSSRSDAAGKQQQRQSGDSQPENTEESESAAGLSDTPESALTKVSLTHTATAETHTAPGADSSTATTVHSVRKHPGACTVVSADPAHNADPAPSTSTGEAQEPQTCTPAPTPKEKTTVKPRRKREETHITEQINKRKTRSQTLNTTTLDTEEAGCSTAHTQGEPQKVIEDIQEQANQYLQELDQLQISDIKKKHLVKTLLKKAKLTEKKAQKPTDTQEEEKMDRS